jgi:DNA repair exonuclease SbcCD ATPase subunit
MVLRSYTTKVAAWSEDRERTSMDPDLNKEVLDVRKVIEKSTSKVSLRDLEKKGFRQVKVLRAGDINQLIMKAVQNVMAKGPRGGMSEEERQKVLAEAKAEVDAQMAQMRQIQTESQRIEAESQRIEEAHKNLEAKLAEANTQLKQREATIERAKAAFMQEKQQLFERGLEGQQIAEKKYESQLADLQQRLARAEARAEGAVSREEHEAALERVRRELQEMETRATRYKRHADELEESEAKQRTRATALQEQVEQLRKEVEEIGQTRGSGMGVADAQELQRMRMEMEQRDAKMKELIGGLAGTLVQAKGAPQDPIELQKHFAKMQQGLSDQLRKMAGSGKGGGAEYFGELTAEAAAAIFAQQDEVKVETNIKDIAVREQSAAGVKDKLSKLKNLRGNKP